MLALKRARPWSQSLALHSQTLAWELLLHEIVHAKRTTKLLNVRESHTKYCSKMLIYLCLRNIFIRELLCLSM